MERRMQGWRGWLWAWLLAAGLAAGCSGNKDQDTIALLTDENERLLKELETTQAELASAQDEVGQHQRQTQTLREQLEGYRGKLESMANPPEDWRGVPGGAMTSVPGVLLFDSGEATLRADAASKLDKVADTILTTFPDKDIFVFGHTDAQPIQHSGWRDNRQLSFERAAAVIRHLEQRGVAPDRMLAVSAGEHRPVVEGVTAEQRNRRVEIYAVASDLVASTPALSP